jgi:hypothetical protein
MSERPSPFQSSITSRARRRGSSSVTVSALPRRRAIDVQRRHRVVRVREAVGDSAVNDRRAGEQLLAR